MEIILLENILNLGNIGDKVKVKSGYGRNYLLPSGKAIIANEENMKVYEAKQEELKLQEEKRLESAKEIFEKINEFFRFPKCSDFRGRHNVWLSRNKRDFRTFRSK